MSWLESAVFGRELVAAGAVSKDEHAAFDRCAFPSERIQEIITAEARSTFIKESLRLTDVVVHWPHGTR